MEASRCDFGGVLAKLTVLFLSNVQHTAWQVHNTMCEQLADRSGPKGYSKWNYSKWLVACHQLGFLGRNFRTGSLDFLNDLDAGLKCILSLQVRRSC